MHKYKSEGKCCVIGELRRWGRAAVQSEPCSVGNLVPRVYSVPPPHGASM